MIITKFLMVYSQDIEILISINNCHIFFFKFYDYEFYFMKLCI